MQSCSCPLITTRGDVQHSNLSSRHAQTDSRHGHANTPLLTRRVRSTTAARHNLSATQKKYKDSNTTAASMVLPVVHTTHNQQTPWLRFPSQHTQLQRQLRENHTSFPSGACEPINMQLVSKLYHSHKQPVPGINTWHAHWLVEHTPTSQDADLADRRCACLRSRMQLSNACA